jgi:hypothetical protein
MEAAFEGDAAVRRWAAYGGLIFAVLQLFAFANWEGFPVPDGLGARATLLSCVAVALAATVLLPAPPARSAT